MAELLKETEATQHLHPDILRKAKSEIVKYFTNSSNFYHSLDHSISVSEDAKRIAEFEELQENEIELLQLAGLFHDTGYASNPAIHESISADIAQSFLTKQNYPSRDIQTIRELILSTAMMTSPKTPLECIIKDADLAHLGKKSFAENSELLRKERIHENGSEIA